MCVCVLCVCSRLLRNQRKICETFGWKRSSWHDKMKAMAVGHGEDDKHRGLMP